MVNANRCRLWLPLVWPFLALCAGGALAAQVCKYDSIPATAPASRFTDYHRPVRAGANRCAGSERQGQSMRIQGDRS